MRVPGQPAKSAAAESSLKTTRSPAETPPPPGGGVDMTDARDTFSTGWSIGSLFRWFVVFLWFGRRVGQAGAGKRWSGETREIGKRGGSQGKREGNRGTSQAPLF